MNLASRHYKDFGCRENQNQQNGVPKSRHSNREPFIVKDRELNELCSGDENSYPAMEEDMVPSSFSALSDCHCHCQTLCGCHKSQPGQGGAGGDGDLVPPSPLLLMSLPAGLCCELLVIPGNTGNTTGLSSPSQPSAWGLPSHLFEDKNLNSSKAPFYIVFCAFDHLLFLLLLTTQN